MKILISIAAIFLLAGCCDASQAPRRHSLAEGGAQSPACPEDATTEQCNQIISQNTLRNFNSLVTPAMYNVTDLVYFQIYR